MDSRLVAFVLLMVLGAIVKIVGGLVYGSRALLLDALTCFSSLAGLAAVLYYLKRGLIPPDADHPYGHSRLRYGGIVASLAAYMFAAGVSVPAILTGVEGYTVNIMAAPLAAIGALFYGTAIVLGTRLDPVVAVYSRLTVSELLESVVSIVSALLGSLAGYVYDLAGALVILAYIFKESIEAHYYLMRMIADTAPEHLYYVLDEEIRLHGLNPVRIRLRMLDEHTCIGDAVVEPPPGMPPEVAHFLIDEIMDKMKRYNCDITIHAEHEKKSPQD